MDSLYGRKRRMVNMKAIDRVTFAAFGFLCMTIATCTKVET